MVDGSKLRSLRERDELSTYELASKVGVSQSAITHFEQGFKQPSAATLQRIAEYFGTTMDDLMRKTV